MDGLEEELAQKIGREQLSERVSARIAEYHGLITRDAAIYLVSLEVFGPRARAVPLSQASGTLSQFKARVRVDRVFQPKIYDKGGREGMTLRAAISDHTGSGTLVCHDDSCAPLLCSIMAGDMVEAEPLRERGDEFHLSHGGKITLAQKGPRAKLSGSEGIGNFEGEVVEFFGDFPVRGKAGGNSMASSFSISEEGAQARVVIWESPGLAGKLARGMKIGIENGVRRGGEIHIGSAGRLLVEKPREDGGEKIDNVLLDAAKGEVKVICNGKEKISLTLERAVSLFGLSPLPEGVKPEDAVALKIGSYAGKPLPRQWLGK